jgi:hypothetical protein
MSFKLSLLQLAIAFITLAAVFMSIAVLPDTGWDGSMVVWALWALVMAIGSTMAHAESPR